MTERLTDPAPYTPDADAIDALADRVAAADLDKPLPLLSLAGVFDLRAKEAECYDLQAAVRIERLADTLRRIATTRPFAPVPAETRSSIADALRHQAVFVRRAEAAHGKPRPAAAPVLDMTAALERRREAETAARRAKTARLIDRFVPQLRADFDPDGGNAA